MVSNQLVQACQTQDHESLVMGSTSARNNPCMRNDSNRVGLIAGLQKVVSVNKPNGALRNIQGVHKGQPTKIESHRNPEPERKLELMLASRVLVAIPAVPVPTLPATLFMVPIAVSGVRTIKGQCFNFALKIILKGII